MMTEEQRNEIARILEIVAKDGLPGPRGLDVALDAIDATLSRDSIPEGGCLKCGALSGDDWSQCKGSCPLNISPHYNETMANVYKDICL